MYENLKGKKLLILGANAETIDIVLKAQSMGIKTIVTDYDNGAPAKKVCDKSYDIDATDIYALYKLAVNEQVDGVLVGIADQLIGTYQKLCDMLHKPCYATSESVYAFTNKRHFKETASKYGILGVPEYSADEREAIQYPVIVKPADNSSSKGISLCHSELELDSAIEFAKSFSKTGTVIIERYMQCSDLSIYYTVVDGEVYLSSLSDRYTLRLQSSVTPICLGDVFPSRYYDDFIHNEHPKFCEMIRALGVRNAVLYVSAFYENGKFYVYDPGFRLQGGGFHLILDSINGFDQRKMLINFALTGYMDSEGIREKNDPLMHGGSAAVIWFLLKKGVISNVEGLEYIYGSPFVRYYVKRFDVGDEVTSDMIGTERQVFLRLFLKCSNKSELKNVIRDFQSKLRVEDINGENLLLPSLDTDFIEDVSDNLYLKNKVVIITGGTKGVGRELSKQCARFGAKVIIAARDERSAAQIIQDTAYFAGQILFKPTDLHSIEQIENLFIDVWDRFGRLDGFVNYAGITPAATLLDCSEELFDDVFSIDIKAAFFCTQHAVRLMKRTGGGSIILVGSTHHIRGNKDRAAYACAKGALLTLSNHIAKHYAEDNIRCNYLTMGWTMTDGEIRLRESQGISLDEVRKEASEAIPLGRMTEYIDIVPGILYLLSDNSLMLTGSEIKINGGELI